MRSRLKKADADGQTEYSDETKPDFTRDDQLVEVFQEIKETAETSSDDLFVQNMAALKSLAGQWKRGRVATIADDIPSSSGRNLSYQAVFPEDGTPEILIEYSSPHPYLMPADPQDQ